MQHLMFRRVPYDDVLFSAWTSTWFAIVLSKCFAISVTISHLSPRVDKARTLQLSLILLTRTFIWNQLPCMMFCPQTVDSNPTNEGVVLKCLPRSLVLLLLVSTMFSTCLAQHRHVVDARNREYLRARTVDGTDILDPSGRSFRVEASQVLRRSGGEMTSNGSLETPKLGEKCCCDSLSPGKTYILSAAK